MDHHFTNARHEIKEQDQFRSVVESHQDKVFSTCYGFLRNREDAEDATQEVFIEVFRSLKDFREEAKLSTWIYRIAVTKSLDMIRKKNRKKRFGQLKRVLGFENGENRLPDSKRPDPEQTLAEQERSRILHEAVGTLNDSQRIALTLSKLEGFSNAEVAGIMDISVSAVETLIHRAKKNLYDKLYHYFKGHPD